MILRMDSTLSSSQSKTGVPASRSPDSGKGKLRKKRWLEASWFAQTLEKMRAGDRWVLVLPPEQAFGLAGRDPDVGPNETIIVDVELHEIEE